MLNYVDENTITTKVHECLAKMTHGWTFTSQHRPFAGNQRKPDMMAMRRGREAVAIEAKTHKHKPDDGIAQMRGYLGLELKPAFAKLSTTLQVGMVLRYPKSLTECTLEELGERLATVDDIEYCIVTEDGEGDFPASGMAKGSLRDIATALSIGASPAKRIQDAAEQMALGMDIAAQWLEDAIADKPAIGTKLHDILNEDITTESCAKACLILTDAFIFQNAVAGKEGFADVRPLAAYKNHIIDGDDARTDIMEDWLRILDFDYSPIFADAYKMLDEAFVFDEDMACEVLKQLWKTAFEITKSHLPQIHELAGEIFQRLIVDRQYVKTNYTLPESAALLSALVCPDIDVDNLPKVADFACGTGALLNGVYKQVQRLYEQKTGQNSRDIHQEMMSKNLGGVDIYPHATHLTFMTMASAHPDIPIPESRVITAKCGLLDDGSYAIGSLDLLDDMILPDIFADDADIVGGREIKTTKLVNTFVHGEMDIVIMNPPYLSESADSNTGNLKNSFNAEGRSDTERFGMLDALAQKPREFANGKLKYSYFVELAHRKLRDGGRMGFVLPATVLTSAFFNKIRELWATAYHNVMVVTIAQNSGHASAFSADTDMAECLVVAEKGVGDNTGRAKFVSLNQRPLSILGANKIAQRILASKSTRRLESIPHGGDVLDIGDEQAGQSLNCPISAEEWAVSRTRSLSLQQTAHRLQQGELHLPLQPTSIATPMCRIGDIAVVGYHHSVIKDEKSGAFSARKTRQVSHEGYPAIWSVEAEYQRAMLTQPNAELRMNIGKEEKATRVLGRNSRTHYHTNLRFNSNSQLSHWTDYPTIGVNRLTNVRLEDPRYDAAWTLWTNSTFGLLCHWMTAGKQQGGRGLLELKTLPNVLTLDVRQLSDEQLEAAERVFADLKAARMLPYHRCADDAWRHILDARLLAEVLGITDEETHRAMQTLREMLCAEPSIAGTSKKRHDLEAERETLHLPGTAAQDAEKLFAEQKRLSRLGVYLPEL